MLMNAVYFFSVFVLFGLMFLVCFDLFLFRFFFQLIFFCLSDMGCNLARCLFMIMQVFVVWQYLYLFGKTYVRKDYYF